MLERSPSRPDDGKTLSETLAPAGGTAVTLRSQADARSDLVGPALTDD